MSVLDNYFGPKKAAEMPSVSPTDWPHHPEHLRPILDEYEKLEGRRPNSPQLRQRWAAGARSWYEEHDGVKLDLLRRAHRRMHDRMLDTSGGPGSCLAVSVQIAARENREPLPTDVCEECGAAYGTHAKGCENA